jgi:transcriptional regulator with XRE-family HTH domain
MSVEHEYGGMQSDAALGARITELLASHSRSQDQLAAVLGIAQSGVSRRLSGAVPIRATELLAIADFLGVTVAELSGRAQEVA